MIEAGRITSIWRYPVKSMAGERVPFADVAGLGVHADRTWAVRDVEHDTTTGAKKLPGLLWCTARYAQPPAADAGPGHAPEVLIGFPDGREFSSSDPGVHRALSEYVDHDVELRALPPISERHQYRTPMATKTDLREVFGLEDDEPLPDLSMFPVRKLAEITRYATPVGSYVDAYPVHILTAQSLAAMAALAPDSDFDERRFRPTLVVDSPAASDASGVGLVRRRAARPARRSAAADSHHPVRDALPRAAAAQARPRHQPRHRRPLAAVPRRLRQRGQARPDRRGRRADVGAAGPAGHRVRGGQGQARADARGSRRHPQRRKELKMRHAVGVIGVLVALFGLLFTLQGFGAVQGSPMSNTTTWSVLGPIIALIGVGLAVAGWRRR